MKRIRKLYFQNSAGERYGLNGERGVYASSLAGFGLMLSPNYADLSRGFFVPVNDESEPQSTLSFVLTFTRSPYETYMALANWINAAGSITIVYDPSGKQEYCRDITTNFMQKGELTTVGWLEIPCSFFCNTPWYLPMPTTLILEVEGADESKRYTYEYVEELRYGNDSTATFSGTIVGAGHIPGSLELTYYGAITNPKIRLVGNISGRTYGICSVAATLLSSDALKLSTRYENAYVKRIAADGTETDLLDALDLSTTPFFHIPIDEPCTVSVEADSVFSGFADLLVFYYYRSV